MKNPIHSAFNVVAGSLFAVMVMFAAVTVWAAW